MPQTSSTAIKRNDYSWQSSLPRTLHPLKNRKTPSTTAVSTIGTKNLTKCVSRQLQVSSKCPKKFYVKEPSTTLISPTRFKSPCKSKNLNSVEASTCPSTGSSQPASSCRKSQSMIELSPARFNSIGNNNLRSGMELKGQLAIKRTTLSSLISKSHGDLQNNNLQIITESNKEQLEEVSKKAGSLICHTLILNAWRQRREEVKTLQGTIQKLVEQIDHSQLQIVVLRRLLDTENNRIGQLSAEVHRTKAQLENTIKEKNELAAEKEILENDAKKFQEVSEERRLISENWKNELLSTKSQLKAVEIQMERDREKLSKLREDKKILLERVLTNEALAAEHSEKAEQAGMISKDLHEQISAQIGTINKLQDDKNQLTRELKDAETENINLKNSLSTMNDTKESLNLQAENLTIQLNDREAALRRIESAYNTQLIELNDLREQLLRQSQQTGWSGRMLQIAGSMVRAPGAILRTLSFLSLPSIVRHP
ncbi:hypothetical protein PV328_008790 [Microctonus aethiopoides]|uniref:Uncharacterized protein n=1 Tax=Microctonus aethiopoides TaxID=144406 RepID=A0AA39KRB5_9HYME|nr:hypothetical protein PV328_008790 [Microctonus aethiopoides]